MFCLRLLIIFSQPHIGSAEEMPRPTSRRITHDLLARKHQARLRQYFSVPLKTRCVVVRTHQRNDETVTLARGFGTGSLALSGSLRTEGLSDGHTKIENRVLCVDEKKVFQLKLQWKIRRIASGYTTVNSVTTIILERDIVRWGIRSNAEVTKRIVWNLARQIRALSFAPVWNHLTIHFLTTHRFLRNRRRQLYLPTNFPNWNDAVSLWQ